MISLAISVIEKGGEGYTSLDFIVGSDAQAWNWLFIFIQEYDFDIIESPSPKTIEIRLRQEIFKVDSRS